MLRILRNVLYLQRPVNRNFKTLNHVSCFFEIRDRNILRHDVHFKKINYGTQQIPLNVNNAVNEFNTEDKEKEKEVSVIEATERRDMSELATNLPPTLTLATYINKSPTLQELVKLGVDLSKLENRKGVPEYVVSLDFEKNIKSHIVFLHDVGVQPENLGPVITKVPFIFKEGLDDLQVRINYLESKRFTKDMIIRIVNNNPNWLLFPVEKIDMRLGFFQKTYKLTGDQVRQVAVTAPKLITYKLGHVQLINFTLKEEMSFSDNELKRLVLNKPKIFRASQPALIQRFELLNKTMNISNDQILQFPSILLVRMFITRQRHLFLQSLGRAQYNPNLPGYVSLEQLAFGSDSEFCENVAKSSIQTFNMFLKTIG